MTFLTVANASCANWNKCKVEKKLTTQTSGASSKGQVSILKYTCTVDKGKMPLGGGGGGGSGHCETCGFDLAPNDEGKLLSIKAKSSHSEEFPAMAATNNKLKNYVFFYKLSIRGLKQIVFSLFSLTDHSQSQSDQEIVSKRQQTKM